MRLRVDTLVRLQHKEAGIQDKMHTKLAQGPSKVDILQVGLDPEAPRLDNKVGILLAREDMGRPLYKSILVCSSGLLL
jgi:hypothetical protein